MKFSKIFKNQGFTNLTQEQYFICGIFAFRIRFSGYFTVLSNHIEFRK